jgi:hypothetical protein
MLIPIWRAITSISWLSAVPNRPGSALSTYSTPISRPRSRIGVATTLCAPASPGSGISCRSSVRDLAAARYRA